MSDTPETDAAAVVDVIGMGHEMVSIEFARKLERERNEAREEISRLRQEVFE